MHKNGNKNIMPKISDIMIGNSSLTERCRSFVWGRSPDLKLQT